jgi:hypothetical protein
VAPDVSEEHALCIHHEDSVVCASETLVPTYQTTRCHDHNMNIDSGENLKLSVLALDGGEQSGSRSDRCVPGKELTDSRYAWATKCVWTPRQRCNPLNPEVTRDMTDPSSWSSRRGSALFC